ncbi:MAG: uracil-DNA glycosylase [Spirochaetaceae bacterium]|nr:MAG: uracil-DNA glycosylase [Spirochaetaceae bacterium]
MSHSESTDLRELLDLFADYVSSGYRNERRFRRRSAASNAAAGRRLERPVAVRPAPTNSPISTPAAGPSRAAVPASEPQREGSLEERRTALTELEAQVRACAACPLHTGRTHAVPGVGVLDPLVMVIGEGPGAEEDARGEPFVGAAGRYLDKWLEAIGLSRTQNVYITNIVKCRPPNNRDPLPNESEACAPFLARQVSLVRPRTILTVGRIATSLLLHRDEGIGKLRGRTWEHQGIPVVPTYHPSGVLRNDAWRRPVWEDLKRLRAILDGE